MSNSHFSDIYRNKKVLVTGHTGFKGSWLAYWLNELGAQVHGISLDIPTTPSHFQALAMDTIFSNTFLDIRDAQALKKKVNEVKPDIVFHAAAQAIVHECYQNPLKAFETNLMGTLHLLEALRNSTTQAAVLITSDKCYQNVEWEYGYRENDRLGGDDPYSASKACAEIGIHSYLKSFFSDASLKACSVRAGNVIGGGDWAPYRIVPDCIRAWAKGESVVLRNPQSTRPWQHVLEPLSGYLVTGQKLLEGEAKLHGESFNFGPQSQQNASVLELLIELKKSWPQAMWEIETKTLHQKESQLLKLSIDKAIHHLNWKPTLNFSETAQFTSKWYQAFYQKESMAPITQNQLREYATLARERGLEWAGSTK